MNKYVDMIEILDLHSNFINFLNKVVQNRVLLLKKFNNQTFFFFIKVFLMTAVHPELYYPKKQIWSSQIQKRRRKLKAK